MAGGAGLDAGYSSTVRQLWEKARPGALARVDALDDAIAAVMGGALGDDQRDDARREAHKLAGSLGTFGLRDATGHAAALEAALESTPGLDRVPELAQHARELRQLVETGEAGGPQPADGRIEVAAVGLAPERAAAFVAAGGERGLAIAAGSELPADWPAIALLDASLPDLTTGIAELSETGTTVAVLLEPDAP
jgi:HPt (histidine-containing phosphotransfer) domain-containing protein